MPTPSFPVSSRKTNRFFVLCTPTEDPPRVPCATDCGRADDPSFPSFALSALFRHHSQWHKQNDQHNNHQNSSNDDNDDDRNGSLVLRFAGALHTALAERGFLLLTCPMGSSPGRLLRQLQDHVETQLFGPENRATAMTSETVYISERGVPMYRLGYERTADGIREMVRLAAQQPDDLTFLDDDQRRLWLRGLGLLRHVTDAVLDLVVWWWNSGSDHTDAPQRRARPYASARSWNESSSSNGHDTTAVRPCYQWPVGSMRDRVEDYSVFYAMHYFNDFALPPEDGEDGDDGDDAELPPIPPDNNHNNSDATPTTTPSTTAPPVAVKAHVDPSLCVVEPFLCPYTTGLQVQDPRTGVWMDCDGPTSPLGAKSNNNNNNASSCTMLLFAGKALQRAAGLPQATLHRVVQGHRPRKTVIYEQKYGEFFDTTSW